MKPLDIACRFSEPGVDGRNCGAEAGEPCRFVEPGTYHAERIADVADISRVAEPVSAEKFTAALESTDLI